MKTIHITESKLNSLIMKKLREQEEMESNISGIELISSHLLFSQTQSHVYHLQTDSYAEHKALQGYYEDIDKLVDSLVEVYQGENENIMNYKSFTLRRYEGKESVIDYFEQLILVIQENREELPSHIQNIIDTVIELITSTLYKLKKLK